MTFHGDGWKRPGWQRAGSHPPFWITVVLALGVGWGVFPLLMFQVVKALAWH